MNRKVFPWMALAVAWMLAGCGPHLVKGPADLSEAALPDSVKAKFSVEVRDSAEGDRTLSGVLFAVPYKRYRMEFSGPMGIGVASLLWQDGAWSLVIPSEKLYATGEGYLVGGLAGIPLFDIHRVASLFWGSALARGTSVDSTRTVSGRREMFGRSPLGIPFVAVCDTNGRIGSVSEGRDSLYLSDYAKFGDLVAPSKVAVYRREVNVLNLRLKSVKTDAEWGGGIWRLPIPENFRRLRD